jgi:hypothetical protein
LPWRPGVATTLPQGDLILAVIHRAQTLDLRATAERSQDLTQRAGRAVFLL